MAGNIIDVDAVLTALDERARVNKVDVREAVFVQSGRVVSVPKSERDEFRFTGLSTTDFVRVHFTQLEPDA